MSQTKVGWGWWGGFFRVGFGGRRRPLRPGSSWAALRGAEAPLFHGAARICGFGAAVEAVVLSWGLFAARLKAAPFQVKIKGSGQECPLHTGIPGCQLSC